MSSHLKFVGHDGEDVEWCDDDKETLKTKFAKLRRLVVLQEKTQDQRTDNEWDEIEGLRLELNVYYAFLKLGHVFMYGVTESKIDAYLEVTKTTPNTPLDWWNGLSLLEFVTDRAIREQGVYTNVACPLEVIEALLVRGGNPVATEGYIPALQIAQEIKNECQKEIEKLKLEKCQYFEENPLGENTRCYRCAKEIEELFCKNIPGGCS